MALSDSNDDCDLDDGSSNGPWLIAWLRPWFGPKYGWWCGMGGDSGGGSWGELWDENWWWELYSIQHVIEISPPHPNWEIKINFFISNYNLVDQMKNQNKWAFKSCAINSQTVMIITFYWYSSC